MKEIGREKFKMPGENGFELGMFFPKAESRSETDTARNYMKQFREEAADRIAERVFNEDGTPNKFWLAFSRRKFLGLKNF